MSSYRSTLQDIVVVDFGHCSIRPEGDSGQIWNGEGRSQQLFYRTGTDIFRGLAIFKSVEY